MEVNKPSFHSPTLDSLSQAAWVIVDDGTPEEKRERVVSGVCPSGLQQSTGGVLLFSLTCIFNDLHF